MRSTSRLRGFDVVQLINPMFLELKARRILPIYNYLRKHNGKMFMGAFGMDYYWVETCRTKKPLRYSDFNIGAELRTNRDAIKEINDWIGTDKEHLNRYIAADCDGIVSGLYEYDVCYKLYFPNKTTFIPFPIKPCDDNATTHRCVSDNGKVKIFIGINKTRSEYKGTDIMLAAAEEVAKRHADKVEIVKAESVPFSKYEKMMDGADIVLDQLYSYTPAMNALLAMSKGIVCVGGGEPESYDALGEKELRPVINVEPNFQSVERELEAIVTDPGRINELKKQSIEFIRKHHYYIKVAKEYEKMYMG